MVKGKAWRKAIRTKSDVIILVHPMQQKDLFVFPRCHVGDVMWDSLNLLAAFFPLKIVKRCEKSLPMRRTRSHDESPKPRCASSVVRPAKNGMFFTERWQHNANRNAFQPTNIGLCSSMGLAGENAMHCT